MRLLVLALLDATAASACNQACAIYQRDVSQIGNGNGNALLLPVVLFCCSPDLPVLAECLLPHHLPDC
jgi:hypothetical protein